MRFVTGLFAPPTSSSHAAGIQMHKRASAASGSKQCQSPTLTRFAMSLRRAMVRNRAGTWLRNVRDFYDLVATGKRHFEEVGSIANDHLCRQLMTSLVPAGKVFLDVGSHIGSVIAELQQNCPGAKVIAFEAIPEKVSFLKHTFPQARIVSCAVGQADTEISFHIDCSQSGYSSISNSILPGDHRLQTITVPLRRLDAMDLPSGIDAMKIDVEGAEQGVISGARSLLARERPIIYFESGPDDLADLGFTKPGLWQAITELGYTIHVPNRVAHADTGLSLEMFIDSHAYPRRTSNYIAIPTERRDEYRSRVRTLLNF